MDLHQHVDARTSTSMSTRVVGPLLTLILATGHRLVMMTQPTALLEQTRSVLRSRFSAVTTKHVFTLQFDRGCGDSVELVDALFAS